MTLYAFNAVLSNPKRPDLMYVHLGYTRAAGLVTATTRFSEEVLEKNPGYSIKQIQSLAIPD